MTTHREKVITLRIIAIILAALVVLVWATSPAHADTGLLVNEWTDGSYRYCEYDVMGDTFVITIDYQDMCQMTVDV
jgi:hypothetical protein